jgi:hypothetical protein
LESIILANGLKSNSTEQLNEGDLILQKIWFFISILFKIWGQTFLYNFDHLFSYQIYRNWYSKNIFVVTLASIDVNRPVNWRQIFFHKFFFFFINYFWGIWVKSTF